MLTEKADVTKKVVSRSHIETTFNNFLFNLYYYEKNDNEPPLGSILHGKVQYIFKHLVSLFGTIEAEINPILFTPAGHH